MASSTVDIRASNPWMNPQFVNYIAKHTMETYYRFPREKDNPPTGFCLPITPQARLTKSPTGGVVGRYLVKPTDQASPPWAASTGSSPTLSLEMDYKSPPRKVLSDLEFYGGVPMTSVVSAVSENRLILQRMI